ncbi:MAG: hypothetical protein HOF01_09780 [Chloroflexi bacterium]|jgi:hypothetical protein|nr:hypothetical protein [Chloroflexota bacterium]
MKLNRANEHLQALNAEANGFLENIFINATIEQAEGGNFYLYRLEGAQVPPRRFGLIIGDFANNLRSCLDYIICQLSLLDKSGRGCDESPRTQFPVISPKNDWNSKSTQRMIQRLSTPMRDIVESFQPDYSNSNHRQNPLWLINTLSNTDKHRNINMSPLAIEWRIKPTWNPAFSKSLIELRIPTSDYLDGQFNETPEVSIVFNPTGDETQGEPLQVLTEIHDAIVQKILPAFIQFFPDHAQYVRFGGDSESPR